MTKPREFWIVLDANTDAVFQTPAFAYDTYSKAEEEMDFADAEIIHVREALPNSGWQPIETAELENDILLYCPGLETTAYEKSVVQGWKTTWGGFVDLEGSPLHYQPTHWLPLPQPPEE